MGTNVEGPCTRTRDSCYVATRWNAETSGPRRRVAPDAGLDARCAAGARFLRRSSRPVCSRLPEQAGAAHRVGAAPAAPSTGSSGTSSPPSWSSATPWSTAPAPLGSAYPTSGVPTAAPFFPPPTGYVPSSGGLPSGSAVNSLAADGIPTVALDAYRRAAAESVTVIRAAGCPGRCWRRSVTSSRITGDSPTRRYTPTARPRRGSSAYR